MAIHRARKTSPRRAGSPGAFRPALILCLVAFGAVTGAAQAAQDPEAMAPAVRGLAWPLAEGQIVERFDPVKHRGVDLQAPPGTPVTAALPGNVELVEENLVLVEHEDGWRTVYIDVEEVSTSEGAFVDRGQPLASVGSRGVFHYEIRRSGKALDPESAHVEPLSPPQFVVARPEPEVTPTPEPVPQPEAVPRQPEKPGRSEETGLASRTENAAEREPPSENGADGALARVALLVGANVFYVPAKAVYASAGAVVGAAGTVLAGNADVGRAIWKRTLGGDYYVTEGHLSRSEPVRFMGNGQEP